MTNDFRRFIRKNIRKAKGDPVTKFAAMIVVDPRGYEWVNAGDCRPKDGAAYEHSLYLYWLSKAEMDRQLEEEVRVTYEKTYDPFATETALFRIFAALPPTPDAVLKFANQYGDIRQPSDLLIDDDHSTLADWREEISRMREAVNEADAYLATRTTSRARKKMGRDLWKMVNEMVSMTDVRLCAAPKNDGLALQMYSTDLLSVMRIQLAESITESKSYRSCEFCNKPFEVTPQINRADRLYCSDNCRVKAHQRRKKQAIELREQGWALRKIVAETGVEMETIKRWIEQASRKEE